MFISAHIQVAIVLHVKFWDFCWTVTVNKQIAGGCSGTKDGPGWVKPPTGKRVKRAILFGQNQQRGQCATEMFTDDYRMFTTYSRVALQRMGFCTCRLPMPTPAYRCQQQTCKRQTLFSITQKSGYTLYTRFTLHDFQGCQIIVPFTPHNLWSCNREFFSGWSLHTT